MSLDVNFNESLTNDVVSFEQLGLVVYAKYEKILKLFSKIRSRKQNVFSRNTKGNNCKGITSPPPPALIYPDINLIYINIYAKYIYKKRFLIV